MKIIQKVLASIVTNKHLHSLKKINILATVLLLIFILFIATTPTTLGKTQRSYQEDFPSVDKTISEVLTTVDCEIVNETLSCTDYESFTASGDYEVSFFTGDRELDKSKIVFDEKTVVIVRYENENNVVSREMNYSRFKESFDFADATKDLSEQELDDLSNKFVYNLYHSITLDEIIIISSGVVLITLMLIVVTVLFFLTINVARISDKLKVSEILNIVLVNYATVLFYAAVFSLISPTIAQMASAFVLIIRLAVTYYYLSNIKRQKSEQSDDDLKSLSFS